MIFHEQFADVRAFGFLDKAPQLWGQGDRLRIPYGTIVDIRLLPGEIEIDADIPLPNGDVSSNPLIIGVKPADMDAVVRELKLRGGVA